MSDTFYLSPCCGDENYREIGHAIKSQAVYRCRKCGTIFEEDQCIIQFVEYGIDDMVPEMEPNLDELFDSDAYYDWLQARGE